MVFSELGDSQGSFSYITPSSDLDIDDATLGKLLTEAHRGQADYCDPEGVSRVVVQQRWMGRSSADGTFRHKILSRIGPTAHGGEVTEGKLLGITIRWSHQGFEWESNSTHVEDMVDLCGLKLES